MWTIQVLQQQFATVQVKLEKMERDGIEVHTKQFGSLQADVDAVTLRVGSFSWKRVILEW